MSCVPAEANGGGCSFVPEGELAAAGEAPCARASGQSRANQPAALALKIFIVGDLSGRKVICPLLETGWACC